MSLATRRSSWPDDAAVAASSISASPACQSPVKTRAMPLKLIAMKLALGSSCLRASSIARSASSMPSRDPVLHQRAERMEDSEASVQRRLGLGLEQMLRPSQPTRADRAGLAAKRLVRKGHGDSGRVARAGRRRRSRRRPVRAPRWPRRACRPTRRPCPAARDRPAARPPSWSAATNTSIASAQACRSIASRPSSTVSTIVREFLLSWPWRGATREYGKPPVLHRHRCMGKHAVRL